MFLIISFFLWLLTLRHFTTSVLTGSFHTVWYIIFYFRQLNQNKKEKGFLSKNLLIHPAMHQLTWSPIIQQMAVDDHSRAEAEILLMKLKCPHHVFFVFFPKCVNGWNNCVCLPLSPVLTSTCFSKHVLQLQCITVKHNTIHFTSGNKNWNRK